MAPASKSRPPAATAGGGTKRGRGGRAGGAVSKATPSASSSSSSSAAPSVRSSGPTTSSRQATSDPTDTAKWRRILKIVDASAANRGRGTGPNNYTVVADFVVAPRRPDVGAGRANVRGTASLVKLIPVIGRFGTVFDLQFCSPRPGSGVGDGDGAALIMSTHNDRMDFRHCVSGPFWDYAVVHPAAADAAMSRTAFAAPSLRANPIVHVRVPALDLSQAVRNVTDKNTLILRVVYRKREAASDAAGVAATATETTKAEVGGGGNWASDLEYAIQVVRVINATSQSVAELTATCGAVISGHLRTPPVRVVAPDGGGQGPRVQEEVAVVARAADFHALLAVNLSEAAVRRTVRIAMSTVAEEEEGEGAGTAANGQEAGDGDHQTGSTAIITAVDGTRSSIQSTEPVRHWDVASGRAAYEAARARLVDAAFTALVPRRSGGKAAGRAPSTAAAGGDPPPSKRPRGQDEGTTGEDSGEPVGAAAPTSTSSAPSCLAALTASRRREHGAHWSANIHVSHDYLNMAARCLRIYGHVPATMTAYPQGLAGAAAPRAPPLAFAVADWSGAVRTNVILRAAADAATIERIEQARRARVDDHASAALAALTAGGMGSAVAGDRARIGAFGGGGSGETVAAVVDGDGQEDRGGGATKAGPADGAAAAPAASVPRPRSMGRRPGMGDMSLAHQDSQSVINLTLAAMNDQSRQQRPTEL